MSGLEVPAGVIAVVTISAQVTKLCYTYLKDAKDAQDDIKRLAQQVQSLETVAVDAKKLLDDNNRSALKSSKHLEAVLENSKEELKSLETTLKTPSTLKPTLGRLSDSLKWPFKSQEINKIVASLAQYANDLNHAIQVDQTRILLENEWAAALKTLPYVDGCLYNSQADDNQGYCLEGTRESIRDDILRWTSNPSQRSIFWLHGMAGTGKSTISRTIAKLLDEKNQLGASYFFKKGQSGRAKIKGLLTTVVRQLGQHSPEFAARVIDTLKADPLIVDKSVKEQFEALLFKPWVSIQTTIPETTCVSSVIVLDALDECEDTRDIQDLIQYLSKFSSFTSPRLLFFTTSRADLLVRIGFSKIKDTSKEIVLQDIEEKIVKLDISKYIRHNLERIRTGYNSTVAPTRQLSNQWPHPEQVQTLVEKATPLFIYAATSCRFIGDRTYGNPAKQLETFLSYEKSDGSQLMAVYLPILDQLVLDKPEKYRLELLSIFRKVVGTIIVLKEPLPISTLSHLLEISTTQIHDLLDLLHAVLRLPGPQAAEPDQEPITLLHLSFRDFLLDPEEQHAFSINELSANTYLGVCCRRLMTTKLTTNMGQLSHPAASVDEVNPDELRSYIPLALEYACIHWNEHTSKWNPAVLEVPDEVFSFLKGYTLQWLEAMSYLGSTHVLTIVEVADDLDTYVAKPTGNEDLSNLVLDTIKFVRVNASVICRYPLQLYSSLLLLSTTADRARRLWSTLLPTWVVRWTRGTKTVAEQIPIEVPGRKQPHDPNLRYYLACALSEGGEYVAAASPSFVYIFNARSGRLLRSIDNCSGTWGKNMVFSPDTKLLAVAKDASYPPFVVLPWTEDLAGTCRVVHPRSDTSDTAHQRKISLSFSPDGSMLATSDANGCICIWIVPSLECIKVLKANPDISEYLLIEERERYFQTLEFSHDSRQILAIPGDGTIHVWDIHTATCTRIIQPHRGQEFAAVAFWDASKILASAKAKYHIPHAAVVPLDLRILSLEDGTCLTHLPSVTALSGQHVFLLRGRTRLVITLQSTRNPLLQTFDLVSGEWLSDFNVPNLKPQRRSSTPFPVVARQRSMAAWYGARRTLGKIEPIYLWDPSDREITSIQSKAATIRAQKANISGTQLSPALVALAEHASAHARDIPAKFRHELGRWPLCTAATPDMGTVAVEEQAGRVSILTPDGESFMTVDTGENHIDSIALSHNGSHLATVSDEGRVCLWDLQPNESGVPAGNKSPSAVINLHTYHDNGFSRVFFSRDLALFAHHQDTLCSIWNLQRQQLLKCLVNRDMLDPTRERGKQVKSGVFSADSTMIAKLTKDALIIWRWELETVFSMIFVKNLRSRFDDDVQLIDWPSWGTLITNHGELVISQASSTKSREAGEDCDWLPPGTRVTFDSLLSLSGLSIGLLSNKSKDSLGLWLKWKGKPFLLLGPNNSAGEDSDSFQRYKYAVIGQKNSLVVWDNNAMEVKVLVVDPDKVEAEHVNQSSSAKAKVISFTPMDQEPAETLGYLLQKAGAS